MKLDENFSHQEEAVIHPREQLSEDAQIWVSLDFAGTVLYFRKPVSLLELGQLFTLLFIYLSIHLVCLHKIPTTNPRAGCYGWNG